MLFLTRWFARFLLLSLALGCLCQCCMVPAAQAADHHHAQVGESDAHVSVHARIASSEESHCAHDSSDAIETLAFAQRFQIQRIFLLPPAFEIEDNREKTRYISSSIEQGTGPPEREKHPEAYLRRYRC